MSSPTTRRKLALVCAGLLVATCSLARLAGAQSQNPLQAFKDAFKKAQQEAQHERSEEPKTPPSSQAAGAPSSQAPASAPVSADDLTAAAPAADVVLDPKVLPDLVGVHLGMPLRTAAAALQASYPDVKVVPHGLQMPSIDKPVVESLTADNQGAGGYDTVVVGVLLPPNQQIVWEATRTVHVAQPMNRGVLLASLRQKYGKETYAIGSSGGVATRDADIYSIYWMYDEHGSRMPLPSPDFVQQGCYGGDPNNAPGVSGNPRGFVPNSDWCASSYVAVHALFQANPDPELLLGFNMEVVDVPLAVRAQKATADWYQNAGERQHEQDVEKSKAQQPKL